MTKRDYYKAQLNGWLYDSVMECYWSGKLTANQMKVVDGYYEKMQDMSDIAVDLGITLKAVKHRWCSIKRKAIRVLMKK